MSLAQKDDYALYLKEVVGKVSEIVAKVSGNNLGENQAHMVESRMLKRFLDLKINHPLEYLKYLNENYESEKNALIGLLTTHHTFFFREFIQFEFLKTQLSLIAQRVKARGENKIKIWSAACSRGQEVYSLAMFLDHYLKQLNINVGFEIWGSDIDSQSVEMAQNGVYHASELKSVSSVFLANHWAKGKEEISDYFKAKKSLCEKIHFSVVNLLELPKNRPQKAFDIIFCRNVLIYFKPEDVQKIANSLLNSLEPGGVLFTGVSEPLGNYKVGIQGIGPSAYHRKDFIDAAASPKAGLNGQAQPVLISHSPVMEFKRPLGLLCVDDSTVVLSLLKKMFEGDSQFKVIATAKNGIEAKDVLEKQRSQIDLMTLDIHMPEMDGIAYLKNHFRVGHPPVVVVSSASRDDASSALECLRLGASDFVEKPSLQNLNDRSEEIKMKLKMAWEERDAKKILSTFDQKLSKKKEISSPEQKMIVFVGSLTQKEKVSQIISSLGSTRPPIVFLIDGNQEILNEKLVESIKLGGKKCEWIPRERISLGVETLYLGTLVEDFTLVKSMADMKQTIYCLLGEMGKIAQDKILEAPSLNVLLEEREGRNPKILKNAIDIFPATSFPIGILNFFNGKDI